MKKFLGLIILGIFVAFPAKAYDLDTLPALDSTYSERIVFNNSSDIVTALYLNRTTNQCENLWWFDGFTAYEDFYLVGNSGLTNPQFVSCYSNSYKKYTANGNEWVYGANYDIIEGVTGETLKGASIISSDVYLNTLPIRSVKAVYPFTYYGYTDADTNTYLKAPNSQGVNGINIDSTNIFSASSDLSFNMQELGYNYKFIPVSPEYFILNDKFTFYFTPDNDYNVIFKINTNYSVVNYRFVLEKDGVQIDDYTFLIDGNSTNDFLQFNRGFEQIQLNLDSFATYRLKFYADDSTDISASVYFDVKSGADDLLQNWYLEANENAAVEVESTCSFLGDGLSYKFCKIIVPPSNYFSIKFNNAWTQLQNKFVFIGQIYSALAVFYSSLNHTDIYPDPINLTFGNFNIGFIDFSDFSLVFIFIRMTTACILWFVTIKYAFNKFSNIF